MNDKENILESDLPNYTLINEWLENLCEVAGVSTSEKLPRSDIESEITLVKDAISRNEEALEDVLVSLRVYLEVLEYLLSYIDWLNDLILDQAED